MMDGIKGFVAASLLLLLAVGAGCANTKPQAYHYSCRDALSIGLEGFSDSRIAAYLDEAAAGDDLQACWLPMVKACLEQDRAIPRAHLARAIQQFNREGDQRLFHLAVYRYLAGFARTGDRLGPADQDLLEAYCSYLINDAKTRRDAELQQAMVLCRRLDPPMYRRLFK
jgi:hypothetical protein